MRYDKTVLYWFIAGSLMGVGFIAFGLGLIPSLIGATLILLLIRRYGANDFWIAVIGMGFVPMLIYSYTILTNDPTARLVRDKDWAVLLIFAVLMVVGIGIGLTQKYNIRKKIKGF